MPLDRHARRILDMLATGGEAARDQLSPGKVRLAMLELARALDPRDLPTVAVEDRKLAGPGGELAIRLYTPAEVDAGPAPGMVFFHGGVGVFCSVETHDALCRMLCGDSGTRVVSVDYRLAPEHPYPAALEDSWFATRWVAENAAQLGIDRTRLAVGGDSAGATLAAVVCQLARESRAPLLAAQLLLCPVTDLCATTASRAEFSEGYFLSRTMLDWAVDQYCPPGIDRTDARLSPLRAADFSGLPRAYIHTAEFDPMRDEGAAYAHALEQAGVEVHYTCHAGLIHHYYGMAGAIPAARRAVREAALSLRCALDRPA